MRALLLAALTLVGIGVGIIGQHLMQTDDGFLAIPLALAIGWFAVADPEQCLRCSKPGEKGDDRPSPGSGSMS